MDLLENVAQELEFDFHLYVVPDGMFGTRSGNAWNGVVGDLVSGAAHMSFAALSVSSARSEVSKIIMTVLITILIIIAITYTIFILINIPIVITNRSMVINKITIKSCAVLNNNSIFSSRVLS